jgi:hypothetical protein
VKVQIECMMLRGLGDDAKPEFITTVIYMGKRTGYSLILNPLNSFLLCFVFGVVRRICKGIEAGSTRTD